MANIKDLTPAEINERMFSRSRDVPWWHEEPNLSWPGRQLLQEYSGYDHRTIDEEVTALVSSCSHPIMQTLLSHQGY